MNEEFGPKRLRLLLELTPGATRFAVLFNPNAPSTEAYITDMRAAAATLGRQVDTLTANMNLDIDASFASLLQKRVDAGDLEIGRRLYLGRRLLPLRMLVDYLEPVAETTQ